jgi:ribose transport system substrate-binding protein
MRVPKVSLVVAVALSTVALAACGAGESDGPAVADQSSVDAGVTAAQEALDAAKQVPAWSAPGPEVDPALLKGKKVFVIPISSSDYETQLQAAEKVAADKAGVELSFYPNQGAVADWVKGMTTAVAQKPDLIFLESSPDPRQLVPQLEAAAKAGIPVVASHTWDTEEPDAPDCEACEHLTAVVKAPFSEGGRLGADWVIADSKGTANVLIVTIDGIRAAETMTAAAQAEYEANCPGCKVTVVSLALTDISNGAISAVTSALAKDADIDYVNAQFDLLLPGVQASMQVGNRSEGVKVFSFNGTAAGLEQVADPDSVVTMNVAEPLGWTAYANMDQIFRILAGMPPVPNSNPIRVFDKTNIDDAGGAPGFDQGFGTDYVTGFEQLWGLG